MAWHSHHIELTIVEAAKFVTKKLDVILGPVHAEKSVGIHENLCLLGCTN